MRKGSAPLVSSKLTSEVNVCACPAIAVAAKSTNTTPAIFHVQNCVIGNPPWYEIESRPNAREREKRDLPSYEPQGGELPTAEQGNYPLLHGSGQPKPQPRWKLARGLVISRNMA